MTVGVSIPAYSNVEALRQCLKSVNNFMRDSVAQIVVVDDSGNGQVAEALRREFAFVTWIVHEQNQGFGASANGAVMSNSADIVILLNDDAELLSDPGEPLRRAFQDSQLFAASFQSLDEHGTFREGAKRLVWRMGYPRILHNPRDQDTTQSGIQCSAYAVGGHAAFRRSMFEKLGGFDALFAPFYWEDVDLSQRAKRLGWKTIYLPECKVQHAGPSSIRSSQTSDYIRETTLRNRLLFAWRHGTPIQRRMLGLSLAWQRTAGYVRGDRIFEHAVEAARARRVSFASSNNPSKLVRHSSGAMFGD